MLSQAIDSLAETTEDDRSEFSEFEPGEFSRGLEIYELF